MGLVGVPLCDVSNIDLLLLDGLEIKLKVDLNNDAFVLMAGETPNNCKLKIMSSTLRVRTVRVADSVKLENVQIMQGHKGSAPLAAICTLTRTPTQARIISQGVLNQTETDLFHVSKLSASFLGSCETMPSTGILQEILSTLSCLTCKTFG